MPEIIPQICVQIVLFGIGFFLSTVWIRSRKVSDRLVRAEMKLEQVEREGSEMNLAIAILNGKVALLEYVVNGKGKIKIEDPNILRSVYDGGKWELEEQPAKRKPGRPPKNPQ